MKITKVFKEAHPYLCTIEIPTDMLMPDRNMLDSHISLTTVQSQIRHIINMHEMDALD